MSLVGSARTVERDGWRFDIGGHRFFTKVPQVEALWHEILPEQEFLLRPRMSRIYYRRKLYDYPLKAMNALRGLGLGQSILARGLVRVGPGTATQGPDATMRAGWSARFGWRLYRTFFKTYTEKLWGMPVTEMPSGLGDTADQEPVAVCSRDQRDQAQEEPEGHHHPH